MIASLCHRPSLRIGNERALCGSYFRSTGISKPRNSNAASPLTQTCNGVAPIGSFARAVGLALLFLRRLHVEAEEFERRIAIDPAVPRMRPEQNDVIGLVGDIAVLFAIVCTENLNSDVVTIKSAKDRI